MNDKREKNYFVPAYTICTRSIIVNFLHLWKNSVGITHISVLLVQCLSKTRDVSSSTQTSGFKLAYIRGGNHVFRLLFLLFWQCDVTVMHFPVLESDHGELKSKAHIFKCLTYEYFTGSLWNFAFHWPN